MSPTATTVTAAGDWVGLSAYSVCAGRPWSVEIPRSYVSASWLPWLAFLKQGGGALALLAGTYAHVLYQQLHPGPAAWAGTLIEGA